MPSDGHEVDHAVVDEVTDLVEHRQEDYPEGMYRQPRPRFWHREEWYRHCPLCWWDDHGDDQLLDDRAVARMDDEAAHGGFDEGGEG